MAWVGHGAGGGRSRRAVGRGSRAAHLPPLRRVEVEDEGSARREEGLAVGVEAGGEERLGGIEVRRVDQDGVEGAIVHARNWISCLLDERRGVLDSERDARVLERLGLTREELLGELDDDLVDLDPHDLDQVGMLHQLRHRPAVAAAHHEHPPCVREIR